MEWKRQLKGWGESEDTHTRHLGKCLARVWVSSQGKVLTSVHGIFSCRSHREFHNNMEATKKCQPTLDRRETAHTYKTHIRCLLTAELAGSYFLETPSGSGGSSKALV